MAGGTVTPVQVVVSTPAPEADFTLDQVVEPQQAQEVGSPRALAAASLQALAVDSPRALAVGSPPDPVVGSPRGQAVDSPRALAVGSPPDLAVGSIQAPLRTTATFRQERFTWKTCGS